MTDPRDHENHDRLAEMVRLSGPRPSPPPDRAGQARAAAHAAWQQQVALTRKRRAVRYTISYALAAAAVLALAITAYRYRGVPPPPGDAVLARVDAITGALVANGVPLTRGDSVPANVPIRTGAADRARIMLANGVEIRIDAGTDLRLPQPAVVALDRGAIFVDTGAAGAKGNAIEVRTAAGIARDIGTTFEVRVTAGATRVRVRDGIVRLDARNEVHRAERGVELTATSAGVVRREVGTAGADWSWVAQVAQPFDIDGETLSAFLDWAAHEGGWTIRFASESLRRSTAGIVLRGSIEGLTPEQALQTILPTCGLTHRIDDGVVIVESQSSGDRR